MHTQHRLSPSFTGTAILILGALYCLLPIFWVVSASTKSADELFATLTLIPSTHILDNLNDLIAYRDGIFWRWMGNTVVYAGVGALGSTYLAALSGYVLARFDFVGKQVVFKVLLAGVLVPGVLLAIPQYLMLAAVNLANTYAAVLLPQLISPYAIYLARIYAAASVPSDVVEAARTEGCKELRIFHRIGLPMMGPGIVTIFLFQFVAIWNNFMLPYIMLGNDELFPLTVGLSGLLNQGASQPSMYSVVIIGALLSVLPLIVLFFLLQRYWRVDIAAGAVKA
ncbi:MAG: carbohydrate ABC transporter permease [Actinomycetaceae bacterium]|nr:carbohydrate ABC transporter permease [Actinomycetaceae bacterium]